MTTMRLSKITWKQAETTDRLVERLDWWEWATGKLFLSRFQVKQIKSEWVK